MCDYTLYPTPGSRCYYHGPCIHKRAGRDGPCCNEPTSERPQGPIINFYGLFDDGFSLVIEPLIGETFDEADEYAGDLVNADGSHLNNCLWILDEAQLKDLFESVKGSLGKD